MCMMYVLVNRKMLGLFCYIFQSGIYQQGLMFQMKNTDQMIK